MDLLVGCRVQVDEAQVPSPQWLAILAGQGHPVGVVTAVSLAALGQTLVAVEWPAGCTLSRWWYAGDLSIAEPEDHRETD